MDHAATFNCGTVHTGFVYIPTILWKCCQIRDIFVCFFFHSPWLWEGDRKNNSKFTDLHVSVSQPAYQVSECAQQGLSLVGKKAQCNLFYVLRRTLHCVTTAFYPPLIDLVVRWCHCTRMEGNNGLKKSVLNKSRLGESLQVTNCICGKHLFFCKNIWLQKYLCTSLRCINPT